MEETFVFVLFFILFCLNNLIFNLFKFSVDWLDHSKTLREQGVTDNDVLLLRRKFFFSDQNIDQRDPIQLNLLYVQVRT